MGIPQETLDRCGLMTMQQAASEYGVSVRQIMRLVADGVIDARAPRGMTRPKLLNRGQMDAWFTGAGGQA